MPDFACDHHWKKEKVRQAVIAPQALKVRSPKAAYLPPARAWVGKGHSQRDAP